MDPFTIRHTATGKIVGQVTLAPLNDWWQDISNAYEIAVEVSSGWRSILRRLAGVQRAQPFAGVHGYLTISFRRLAGVQRAQPFAGVRGRASGGCRSASRKTPFTLFATAGGQSKRADRDILPFQEKSVWHKKLLSGPQTKE
jgi:hypothetical protein